MQFFKKDSLPWSNSKKEFLSLNFWTLFLWKVKMNLLLLFFYFLVEVHSVYNTLKYNL